MKFVIRAGGIGTRLWPYSRARKPKQFHCMAGEQTMLQDAVARIGAIAAPADVYVSTGGSLQSLVSEQVPALHDRVLARTPAGRWGEIDDFQGIAVFLASRASDFVTGAVITVDGGFSVSG